MATNNDVLKILTSKAGNKMVNSFKELTPEQKKRFLDSVERIASKINKKEHSWWKFWR